MAHFTSSRFWKLHHALPKAVRQLAGSKFELLRRDPRHPSLHFKRIGRFWTVRISENYRAVGVDAADGIVWIWIGAHPEYEKLIQS